MIRTLSFVLLATAATAAQESAPASRPRVVFLTHSAGFKHEVVTRKAPDVPSMAEEAFVAAAGEVYDVLATQDCADVAGAKLAGTAALVCYTTGELPLAEEDRARLVDWVRRGGALVGVHPATDTLYESPSWGAMFGARFDGHPWHEKVGVLVDDPTHPSAVGLGRRFEIADEIYQFRAWTPEPVRVVLRLDPASVDATKGARADRDYALAWARPYGRGRVFYTALGHRPEVWRDARFLKHLVGGLDWAVGRAPWTPSPPRGATPFTEGRIATGRVQIRAELDLAAAPDALREAAIELGGGVVLRAGEIRRRALEIRGDGPAPTTAGVDVRYEPDRESGERVVAWIDGIPAPNLAERESESAPTRALRLRRPEAWRGAWILAR